METINLEQLNIRRKLPNIFLVSGGIGMLALFSMAAQARLQGDLGLHHWRGTAVQLLPMLAVSLLGLALGWRGGWVEGFAGGLQRQLRKWGSLNWILFGLVLLVFPAIALTPFGGSIDPYFPRFWLFAHLVMLGAVFCQAGWKKDSYVPALLLTLVVYGVGYQVASYFPKVNNSPLSLDWSEASRYYYASLFFARGIYGAAYSLPTLHPSRYLLQSIPFLIPGLPIVVHRIWQVLLWVGMTGLAAVLVARRLKLRGRVVFWLFAGWAYLFLMQGPVYYHLMVCALLVLWGFDARRFWRSLGVVALASAWAGISRINWLPVPGVLAAVLYLLEIPLEKRPVWRYLLPGLAWTAVGTAIGYAVQLAYIPFSGAPADEFGSSLTSPLLPYRLLPSVTYPTGILLGILLAAGPLVGLILAKWLPAWRAWHPLRALGIAAALGVFFAGGMLVSIKIGGGSNLHNLDAFLLFLLVVGAYVFFERFTPDHTAEHVQERAEPKRLYHPGRSGWVLLALAVALPLLPVVHEGGPLSQPSAAAVHANVTALQKMIDALPAGSGEVLFIYGRQLVTFHQVQVPAASLEPDFETVFLMEMAMANQPRYLGDYERDLREHRFALVVTAPLSTEIQDSENDFAEENNAWAERVSVPTLKYYQEKASLKAIGLQVLEPKP
jgi:hypothetical protein